MATLTEVTTQPASGLNHIDALLDKGPGWNWLAPTRTTIVYTFSVTPSNPTDVARLSTAVTAFNATQQAAAVAVLNTLSAITGISFVASADANAADVHFGAANITEAGVVGLASWDSTYSYSGNTVSNYRADAWIYLDNAEFAATNGAPVAGNAGYQVLLHELGHAFGLKHPFAGSVTLPAAQDNTALTLMSYNASGGPYATYNSYDIAALMWLYGGDGLGGLLGYSTASQYIVGTALVDTLVGGSGDDVFEGGAGNDAINGGAGSDTARYSGNRALYTITTVPGGFQVAGPDGSDALLGIEKARFLDETVVLQAGGNSAPSGALTVSGTPLQAAVLTVNSTLADSDGLGALSYRWQQSSSGALWSDIAGAGSASFAPGEAQVGLLLRVVGSYIDGQGNSETVNSSATAAVANVNDTPSGAVAVSGLVEQGQTLQASNTLADADGLGPLSYEWQSSSNGNTWSAITGAGASGGSFVLSALQVGQLVRVLTRYTDGQGTPEAVASNASAAVLGVQTGTSGDDRLDGSAFADRLSGLSGNDRLAGLGGADQIVGGSGIDTAVFELPRASYEVAAKGVGVRALVGSEGSDALSEIERVRFADTSLAFDINGSAGLTAKILGAVFGREAVANTAYVGIGLKLLDAGTSPDALMQLALEARLGAGYTAAAEVQLLYRNLAGVEPSASDLSYWSAQLAVGGAYTPVSLAWFAANLDLNAQNINLIGLADTGLAFT